MAVAGLAVAALATAATARFRPAPPSNVLESTERFREVAPQESAGLCPWRHPQSDRLSLFPRSDHAEQRLLTLSDLRPEILRRLGKGGVTDGNALYIYRIFRGGDRVGLVMVQRAPGKYGAIEYVAGLAPDGRVVGVRIQSQREPGAIARAIDSPAWRGSFIGKTASDAFAIGGDLPAVPAEARETATTLGASIRRLVVETTVGMAHGRA